MGWTNESHGYPITCNQPWGYFSQNFTDFEFLLNLCIIGGITLLPEGEKIEALIRSDLVSYFLLVLKLLRACYAVRRCCESTRRMA
jgi:hypothetical protein